MGIVSLAALGAGLSTHPAAAVPVPSQIGRVDGNHHVVAGANRDLAVAVRAEIAFVRLVRLQELDVDLAVSFRVVHQPKIAQRTSTAATRSPAPTYR